MMTLPVYIFSQYGRALCRAARAGELHRGHRPPSGRGPRPAPDRIVMILNIIGRLVNRWFVPKLALTRRPTSAHPKPQPEGIRQMAQRIDVKDVNIYYGDFLPSRASP